MSFRKLKLFSILIFVFYIFVNQTNAAGASLYLAPSQGTFFVGSTFSVSIYLDTKGSKINALQVDLRFPPDILQVTTPMAGKSFISEWIVPPNYSNLGGTISFQGGIPEGIVTSGGLISTITFRARSPGKAKIEILDSSKVLLADGKGTQVFTTNFGGTYEILVPPPEGPKISSLTHPDSDIWYSNSNPQFSWTGGEGVTDFSFVLSQNPHEIPDTIPEGKDNFISFQNIEDGIWYFHLRAKKGNIWGKTSHFGIKIDTTPPLAFEPEVDISSGFVYFDTKDLHSGIDFYEISLINLTKTPKASPFFIEATSPFKLPREAGKYRIVIRAFDRTGNFQTSQIQFRIFPPLFALIEGKGIAIKGFLFSWRIIYFILFIFVGSGIYLIFYLKRRTGFRKGIKEIEEALREIEKLEERERETEKLKKEFEKEKAKLEEKLMREQ